jgi:2-oxo-4-hydroxy-4-carboxy-5-ureidoimidazoline decarboxylase
MVEVTTPLAQFDVLGVDEARDLLRRVCASDVWLDAMIAARPYQRVREMLARSDVVMASLDSANVEQALASHPRIGERAGGADQESAWSREEQAGAVTAGEDLIAALHRGNIEYEARFGHVFLMCATGRSPEQMLAAMYERMDNEPEVEHDVVRRELAAIVRLRIVRLLR